jgi:hypothetical protein
MSSSKKIDLLETLRQVFLCLRSHTGKRGWELNQREGWRGDNSQSWVEYTNTTDRISDL